MQRTIADDGKPEAEAGKRVSGVELDRAGEFLARDSGAELDQRGKAKYEVHALKIRRQRYPFFRRFTRAVAVAEHEPQFAEPGPGERIVRLPRGRLQQRIARAFQVEIRLLCVGESNSRRRRVKL